MNTILRTCIAAAILLLSCAALSASTITAGAIGEFTLVNATIQYPPLGVYVAPYEGRFNGIDLPSGVVCLDYSIHSSIGATWRVRVSLPQTDAELDAAFLVAKYLQPGHLKDPGPVSLAIWKIMMPLDTAIPWTDTAALAYFNEAEAAPHNAADYAGFRIFTPLELGSTQRFMGQVPEPGSFILMAGGALLIGLGKLAVNRRRAA